MENVASEQGLLTKIQILTKSFKFPKNSSCQKNLLCNVRRLKLGHFHIFDMLFSFLASALYHNLF